MDNIEVVGLGALNTDNIYLVERIIDDGESVVKETVSLPGGSAANTIYCLGRLGISAGFIGVTGDDAEGKVLLEDFQKVGVDTSRIITKPGARTGSVLCLSDDLGKRSLYVQPGANSLLSTDDIDTGYINQARVFHLSSFVDLINIDFIKKLGPSVKVSFAPGALYSSMKLEALSPILARTHVLFVNRGEIEELTGKEFRAGAELCLARGCQIVAVTLGKGIEMPSGNGAATVVGYIRDAAGEYFVEKPVSEMAVEIDTIGAGDAFAAGFLFGLLRGKGLKECGNIGSVMARFSITKVGARQGLPDLNSLKRQYRQTYNRPL